MVRKDEIREKILGLGADVCGFGGMERFIEAPVDFRPTDLYTDCKSVIAVGIALPKGLLRVEPRLIYGHFNADVVHKGTKCLDSCPVLAIQDKSVTQKKCRQNTYGNTARGFDTVDCNKCRRECPMRDGL